MRIIRVPMHHRTVFQGVLQEALAGIHCLRYRGQHWTPLITRGRSFAVFAPAPDPLAGIREGVEDYERTFYGSLLRGCCGPDGALRPRTRLQRAPSGAWREAGSLPGVGDAP